MRSPKHYLSISNFPGIRAITIVAPKRCTSHKIDHLRNGHDIFKKYSTYVHKKRPHQEKGCTRTFYEALLMYQDRTGALFMIILGVMSLGPKHMLLSVAERNLGAPQKVAPLPRKPRNILLLSVSH
jgi:hypothetical protein